MTDRIFNFSAGPAVLPEPVLQRTQAALWNLDKTGIGVAEHSHRGKAFARVRDEAEARCRALAGIGDGYDVLFLQGGASLQFAMVPMNLLPAGRSADYILTGTWSKKALAEAKRIGTTRVAASTEEVKFTRLPTAAELAIDPTAAYVHLTTNNTIVGTQWPAEPAIPSGVPLVADLSSDIFSRPIDVARYGLIYAGAQKNLGPAGLVLVIIRKDLVAAGRDDLPVILQYRTHAKEQSLYNTPNTLAIYMLGEVFKWIEAEGGLEAMALRNRAKAAKLYDFLDESSFFTGTVAPEARSLMNVCFRSPSEALDSEFLETATRHGLSGLKGHRSVGGMRASIYNACPVAAIEALIDRMHAFEREHASAAVR